MNLKNVFYKEVMSELGITETELTQGIRIKENRILFLKKQLEKSNLSEDNKKSLGDEYEMLNDEIINLLFDLEFEKNGENEKKHQHVLETKNEVASKFTKVGGGLRFWEK